jgi:hypothetical protein
MKTRRLRIVVAPLLVAIIATTLTAFAQEKAATPAKPAPPAKPATPMMMMRHSIEGTYKLISRKLPDGKTMMPPDIQGLQTFTRDYRNFNIVWADASGKHFSYSVISSYRLTDKDYTETLLYSCMNDEIGMIPGGKPGLNYVLKGESKTEPVKTEDGKLEFKLPFDPPNVVIEGNKMTATLPDGSVDNWEKVR